MARRKFFVGQGVHPFVKAIAGDVIDFDVLSSASGMSASAIRKWFTGDNTPKLENFEAVLNSLGYALELVKKDG